MRYLLGCILLFLFLPHTLFAQQDVGFTDPDNLKPLLNYRLPDWGYDNFYVNFSATGSGLDSDGGVTNQVRKSGAYNFRPNYNLYRESEERILNTDVLAGFSYNTRSNSIRSDAFNTKDKTQSLDIVLSILSSVREYINKGFIYGSAEAELDYYSNKREFQDDGTPRDERLSYTRIINLRPRIGYGIGRVRNVNPVIRALRLKERSSVLGRGINFNRNDILAAAEQFTRYDAYQRAYDRPEKHFWGDMDNILNRNLASFDSYDMLFLTDVLDEAIGRRLEGWEVIGGLQFDYRNELQREEEPFTIRDQIIGKKVGAFLDGRWYTNTSLRQQFGLVGNLELNYPIESTTGSIDPQREFSVQTGVSWLWNVTDRVLLQSSLANLHTRVKQEGSTIGGQGFVYTEWANRLTLNMNINYFLENRLQLNASLRPSLQHAGDSASDNTLNNRTFSWDFGIGLRYYLSRNVY